MSNIMSQIKLKNHVSRDGFDLSRRNAFTAKVGELLPVCCMEVLPGDSIKARVQHFTRTQPVNTAAYTRVREYYDWFFVPTNLLWNKFNSFITQMVDNNQHATSINGSQQLTTMHPYFTCNQLANYLATITANPSSSGNKNEVGLDRALQTAKLLEYLGYGHYYDSCDGTAQTFARNANLNPFPLLAYQKIYQDYFRNSQWESAYAPAFNIDYISGAADSLNIPISELGTQYMSNRVINMLDMRYSNWNKDLFMGVLPNSQFGDAASILSQGTVSENPAIHIDLPFNVYPFSGNSLSSQDALYIQQWISQEDGYSVEARSQRDRLYQRISKSNLESLRSAMGLSGGVSITSAFTILALRQSEALQKWKEITQSHQQDYKQQIESHFGVSMSDAYSERCQYIDGSVTNLDISEVTNTNITADNAADIAGKGIGVGDGNMNYKATCHGYLMCIYHAVPLLDYAIDGICRTNLKTMVTDYAIPEFDRTGMVQVPMIELANGAWSDVYKDKLLGYAPRYYDYKQAIDQVHGAFINGGLGAWVAPVGHDYLSYMLSLVTSDIQYQFYKVRPQVLDPIFSRQVDSTNESDQFLVNAAFDIKAVRNLDRNGLPY